LPYLLVLTLIVSLFVSACSNKQGTEDHGKSTDQTKNTAESGDQSNRADTQILQLASDGDISTMDVNHATDGVSLRALEEVRSGLMRLDVKGNPIPDMAAAKPKISKDQTIYTFTLREDAKWSNGDPVTAQDFVYSWKKEVSKDTAAEYAYIFASAGIKNAAKIMNPDSDLYNKVDKLGIKAIDKHTLQVTLERPIPFFLSLLSFPTFFPKNEKVAKKYGAHYATEPDKMVYNGPFTMTDWNHGEGWTFEKNPKYWDAKNIQLSKVQYKITKDISTRIKLYQSGKLDYTNLNSDYINQFKGKSDLHTGVLGPSMVFLRLNEKNPVLDNEDVRDAIYNAINRKNLVKFLLKDGSAPAHYLVGKDFATLPNGEDFRSAHPTINKHSLKWAKNKWNKGLKEVGKTSVKLELLIYDDSTNKKIAQYIAAQLEKNLPGMKITLNTQPLNQFLKVEGSGNYDISLGSWGPDYPDPMSDLDMWVTGGPFNRTGYSNKTFDQLIHKAKHLGAQPAKRMKVMQKAEKILLEDAPVIPLYQPAFAYLQKPYVKQFLVDRPGPNNDWTYTFLTQH
ncbi:MAG TPA: peptide ABC transporter substrate-binding protein, partial [Bacillales bacterium]|nr:peptide ABC transporter substrate-binding protein [Bacillales bacterium]